MPTVCSLAISGSSSSCPLARDSKCLDVWDGKELVLHLSVCPIEALSPHSHVDFQEALQKDSGCTVVLSPEPGLIQYIPWGRSLRKMAGLDM